MNRLAAVVLAVLFSGGGTALALDDKYVPGKTEVQRSIYQGPRTTPFLGRTTTCEVWQDYTYIVETGEIIAWGAPYLRNCTTSGGTTDRDNECNGQDPACRCRRHPEECSPNDPCKTGRGPRCPQTPPKSCQDCLNDLNGEMNAIAAQQYACVTQWGDQSAHSQCLRGLTRNGYDAGLDAFVRDHGGPDLCVNIPGPIAQPPFCVRHPSYQNCYDDFMQGWHMETITDHGTIGSIKVTAPLTIIPLEAGVTVQGDTVQTTIPEGQGYASVCRRDAEMKRATLQKKHEECTKNATNRDRNTNTCATGNVPLTPVGRN